jgi:hypothetical protein
VLLFEHNDVQVCYCGLFGVRAWSRIPAVICAIHAHYGWGRGHEDVVGDLKSLSMMTIQ